MLNFTRLLPRFDQNSDMATANSSINSAGNVGQNAINSYDPTAAGNTSAKQVTQNFGTAQSQNAAAVDPLQSVVNSNPTVTSLYNQGNDMFNVPALKNTATRLQNSVTNAIPDAYQAAKGFDISATDINNGVAAKTAYLTPQANAATANANTAAGLAQGFVTAGQAQNAQNLIPAQENAALTAQNQAAEATGWNQAQKSTLDGLISKMQSGVTLSQNEMDAANKLAATEASYNQAVVQANASVQVANIGNQYKSLAPSETLYNTSTGQHYTPIGKLTASMAGTNMA